MNGLKRIFIAFILSASIAYALTDSFLKMVSIGGPKSLDEALILLPEAQGTDAKELASAISKSMVQSPRSFLKILRKHSRDSKKLTSLVISEVDGDPAEEIKNQISLRIDALNSVDDKELLPVRNQCLSVLESKLKGI